VKVAIDASRAPALGSTVSARPRALAHGGVQVIKLPLSALRQDGKNSAVWVLDKASMTVRSQPVQLATADGNDAVVAGGLTPGMQVVVAGVHVLSPNQKVTAYRSKAAMAATAASGSATAPAPASVQPASAAR
ncbi:MAG: efflux RND transporter periplasmic adaptor subunit, partial [Comamonadaceae bacterium]